VPKKHFWLWEIWLENRDIFKAVIRDILFFVIWMLALACGRVVVESLPLSPDQRHTVELTHFRITWGIWVLMSVFLAGEIIVGFGGKLIETVRKHRKPSNDDRHKR
jgi:hypothetical protein